jgi:hypothetical protein
MANIMLLPVGSLNFIKLSRAMNNVCNGLEAYLPGFYEYGEQKPNINYYVIHRIKSVGFDSRQTGIAGINFRVKKQYVCHEQ